MSQPPTSYEPYSPGRPGPEKQWRPSDAVPHEEGTVVRREHAHARTCGGGAPSGLVVASVVCVVVWAMSGFGYFWPIWVLLPTFLLSGIGRRKMNAAADVSGRLRRRGRS
jgi:hypothetical protein